MSFSDRVKFWKKEEIPDFPRAEETPVSPSQNTPLGFPQENPSFAQPFDAQLHNERFQPPSSSLEQQVQLLNAKLDTIKAQLETVLQRLDSANRKEEPRPYQERWRNL